MEEILEQIQSLTDKFNNLFEVEGLGEPSGDVPPSTNKLKKDIKTKNGKVELVSVEDELFPKEGNAKEQFKQKVLDKINAMIQGTGTLEDLLNVVRAKQIKPVKEGFEGAIEILEEIINEVSVKRWRQAAINSLPQRAVDAYKAEEETEKAESRGDIDKAFGNQIQKENRLEHAKEVAKTMPDSNKSANKVFQAAKKVVLDRTRKSGENFKKWKTADTKENAYKAYEEGINLGARERHAENLADAEVNTFGNLRKRNHKNSIKEGFEGVIEILEEIIKERYENGYTEAPKGHKHKVGDEVQVHFGAGLDGGKSGKINSLYKNHNGNTWAKGSGADGDFDVPTSYLRTRKVSQDSVKEGFEGAIEVLEELLQCLGESSYTEDTVNKVAKKVRPQREANARKAHASLNHVMNINPYNMINGKLSKKQQELISKALDKANKADDKLAHVNSILNKSKKENKPNGIKFDKILCNYEEAIEMLEGLFVKDGRGDLVDDVVKTITKKPVMKHVQDFTKNLLKPKVKPENK